MSSVAGLGAVLALAAVLAGAAGGVAAGARGAVAAAADGAGTSGVALLDGAVACRRRISLSKQASRAAESLTLKHFSMGSKESCVSAISENNAKLSRINALTAVRFNERDPTSPLPLMFVPFLIPLVHAREK
jgi:hypothetical protein